jgi:hypothetical protein
MIGSRYFKGASCPMVEASVLSRSVTSPFRNLIIFGFGFIFYFFFIFEHYWLTIPQIAVWVGRRTDQR